MFPPHVILLTDVSTAIAPPPNRQTEVHNPPEPMQTDSNRLTTSERQRRLTQHLYLYCGAWAHDTGVSPSSTTVLGECHPALYPENEPTLHL